jgi:uncharacterized protein (DUF1697 family)
MSSTQYLALLRGINVGGSNVIRMNDLRACIEGIGLEDVTTFIQSGNVLFKSGAQDKARLTLKIEGTLSRRFNYNSRVVVLTQKELNKTIQDAPKGFGKSPDAYRYDVLFLKEPMTSKEAMKTVPAREGVDTVNPGKNVLYYSRLLEKISQSRISRIATLPLYQFVTIRNWNTTLRLSELMNSERLND